MKAVRGWALGRSAAEAGLFFHPCLLRTCCFLGGFARRQDHTINLFLCSCNQRQYNKCKSFTTFNNGSLGSGIDEERSEMRYVV